MSDQLIIYDLRLCSLNLISELNLFLHKISIDHIFELIRSLLALES